MKLIEVCEIINGGTPDTSIRDYWDGDKLWITPKDMGQLNDVYVSDTLRKISDAGLKKSSAKLLPVNSIILSSRAPIGHLAINSKPLATNQGCKGLIPKNNVQPQFLYYFLSKSVELLNSLGTGATFKELSVSKLGEVEIPIPTLSEQKRIVSILDLTFASIAKAKANAEQNLINAKELFESHLNSIFSNKNDGWAEKTLGEIYDVRDGTHDSPKYRDSGFPLITSKNLKKDFLDYSKVNYISEADYININKRSRVDKGDVLFAMIGTIGNPVVIRDEPNFAIKNVALFKVPKDQNSNFLKYYLDTKTTKDKMIVDAKGTTQKFVGLGYLRSFKIQLPPLTIQHHIVKRLDILSLEIKRLETVYQQKLFGLEELKKSILQKAFSGEL